MVWDDGVMPTKKPTGDDKVRKLMERELLKDVPLEFQEPNSSLVISATYDPDTRNLTITLKAGQLAKTYYGGPLSAQQWVEFYQAQSKGSYFNRFIRPMVNLRPVEG